MTRSLSEPPPGPGPGAKSMLIGMGCLALYVAGVVAASEPGVAITAAAGWGMLIISVLICSTSATIAAYYAGKRHRE